MSGMAHMTVSCSRSKAVLQCDLLSLHACQRAGVAAAFRSPVGGVLFALEEMTSWFRNQLLWHAFFTTAVVSVAGAQRGCGGENCPVHLAAVYMRTWTA